MKKILIIEDEIAYMQLLNDQLTEKGHEIIEAKDGKEGLAIAKSQKPDLILLDITMPKMDGIKMLSELRKDAYGKAAKIIILTNFEPDEKVIEKVLRDQPFCYLMKSDIQFAELVEKIEEVLG
jgi:DNA-binding response OmpR family regulator